jgi:hypothetical protein
MLSLSVPAAAQSNWLYASPGRSVTVEAYKLGLGPSQSITTSTLFFTGKIDVQEGLYLVLEVPISNFDYDKDYQEDFDAQTMVGNPYVGVEWCPATSSVIGSAGLRFPTAPEGSQSAAYNGGLTAFDRVEAFANDMFTVYVNSGYRWFTGEYHSFQVIGGPVFTLPTIGGADPDILIDYKGEYWARADAVSFGIGLTGRVILTEGDLNFHERTWHRLGFSGNVLLGQFRPGFNIRVPLDEEIRNVITYGINLTVDLK